MPRHRVIEEEAAPEINLSPMIDCIFILLIFFIVTTVFVEEVGLDVNKPQAASSVSIEENDTIEFLVTADGEVLYEGEDIGVNGVAPKIKQLMVGEDIPVSIKCEKKGQFGMMAKVYAEAVNAGAENVHYVPK
ncbi:biopolymer transporter ExbD [Ruficoccus sp. ZRK36]|uniref:ExbD/TolR family protein n=1 Tax=Ruficoccus sp. ZRK36 TaxID=2866311 RepID=UPI001C72B04C|nr:biopolymer transporter ExbD [Ruficoccus sp. ZRK36]QYY37372.1 biopolymer transporter ExbD [Ruficoccus sp. ZRK36]